MQDAMTLRENRERRRVEVLAAVELADTRQMLDSRYDDIKSGKVKMIPGDEAFASLMAKTAAERKRSR